MSGRQLTNRCAPLAQPHAYHSCVSAAGTYRNGSRARRRRRRSRRRSRWSIAGRLRGTNATYLGTGRTCRRRPCVAASGARRPLTPRSRRSGSMRCLWPRIRAPGDSFSSPPSLRPSTPTRSERERRAPLLPCAPLYVVCAVEVWRGAGHDAVCPAAHTRLASCGPARGRGPQAHIWRMPAFVAC